MWKLLSTFVDEDEQFFFENLVKDLILEVGILSNILTETFFILFSVLRIRVINIIWLKTKSFFVIMKKGLSLNKLQDDFCHPDLQKLRKDYNTQVFL